MTVGGEDFVGVYAEKVYGIPPEQVVGSALGTKYGYDKDGKPTITPRIPSCCSTTTMRGNPKVSTS